MKFYSLFVYYNPVEKSKEKIWYKYNPQKTNTKVAIWIWLQILVILHVFSQKGVLQGTPHNHCRMGMSVPQSATYWVVKGLQEGPESGSENIF